MNVWDGLTAILSTVYPNVVSVRIELLIKECLSFNNQSLKSLDFVGCGVEVVGIDTVRDYQTVSLRNRKSIIDNKPDLVFEDAFPIVEKWTLEVCVVHHFLNHPSARYTLALFIPELNPHPILSTPHRHSLSDFPV